MKKITLVILALLAAVILTACSQNNVPSISSTPPESSQESESTENGEATATQFINDGVYQLTADEYKTSIEYMAYQPPISDGRFLASNLENHTDRDNARTVLYDTKNKEETEIEIFAQEPMLYGGYIYYAFHDAGNDASGSFYVGADHQKTLIRRDIETGEEKVIYEVDGDVRIGRTPRSSDRFLAWYEFPSPLELDVNYILSEDDEVLGMYGETVVFDLETEKVVYRAENTITASAYSECPLRDGGMIILTVEGDTGYTLKLVDFMRGETIYEKNVDEIPYAVEYDNQKFAYLNRGVGIDVFDTFTGEKIISIPVDMSTGNFSDVKILDGRFLIYGKPTEVFVQDLNTGETVYDCYDGNVKYDNADYPYQYIHHGFFTVDREFRQVIYRRTDRANEGASDVVVLSFTEG